MRYQQQLQKANPLVGEHLLLYLCKFIVFIHTHIDKAHYFYFYFVKYLIWYLGFHVFNGITSINV